MATFILTWNPDLFRDTSWYDDYVSSTAREQTVLEDWSTGVRRGGIVGGDRAFLLRQHRDRGLVASGEFTSRVFQGPHWDGSGREANYADVGWDTWLSEGDRLPVEELQSQIPEMVWDRIQGSGVQLPPDAARRIEELWEAHLARLGREIRWFPEEVGRSEAFVEGAVTRVVVNRYERDPRARTACLAHWGYDCVVCGFSFVRRYGSIGKDYIHVHHLVELSSLGRDYEVDAVQDLRPVCPNCHAMLHQRRPALTITELRRRLRGRVDLEEQ
jgi:5-methylcytosine-specific restriction enzyme A